MADERLKFYHETSISSLSTADILSLYPPNTVITKGGEDFPFGTTVADKGVYVDPSSNEIHVTDVNGQIGSSDIWPFAPVRVVK